jgi:hypothetical protein
MAAEPVRRTLVVPPEVVAQLRHALVTSLESVGGAISDLLHETARDRRRSEYRELVSSFNTRYELQEAAGWPDDPELDTPLLIHGSRACDFAMRCLRQHRDAQLGLRELERLEGQTPPSVRGSVDWPGFADEAKPPDALDEALDSFLRANGGISGSDRR